MRGWNRWAGAAAAVALGAWSMPARAGGFFDDGSFFFDPEAAVAFDFEDGVPEPTDPRDPPLTRVEVPDALSGRYVLTIEPFEDAFVAVELPPEKRTYRASVWVRGGDSSGFMVVGHEGDGRAAEVAALYPTGRVTSDGWVELANDGLRIDGARSGVALGVFSPGGAEIDAIEMVADGNVSGEVNVPCAGAVDASACGEGQVCYWGECRNVNGWVPPIPADRDQVRAYLENRLRFLFGPFLERALDMPASLVALEGMQHAEDPWSYWNAFALAVRRLHDGHTSTNGLADFVLENPKPLAICFVEGDADLTHGTAPKDSAYLDVLVSHVGADHNLGLQRGDRLVRIDGQHPIAWSRSLIEHNWNQPSVSNHHTFAEHASRLRNAISRFAHEIEVIRCNGTSCGAVETISITDLPPDPRGTPVASVSCDSRPLRHVPGAPAESHAGGWSDVFAGLLLESNPTEKIYGVEWESLYTTTGSDGVGANLNAAIQLLKNDAAKGVIFDHRTGTGGTLAGPQIVWDFAVAAHPVSFMQTRQRAEDEQPSLADGLAIFQKAVSQNDAEIAGSNNPATIPIALLITQDVSASDWLPLGLKNTSDNVRIFGPYATNGAFSTFYEFGFWLGMNVALASADSYLADGSTANGTGIEPDVVVLPKQSDLVIGKDTVFEAALAWVRSEVTP